MKFLLFERRLINSPRSATQLPIRLPLDIIAEIFIACLPTHRNCVMSATEAPVILGRICSSWRTISLSTPRLWSRLHIVQPESLHWPNGPYEARVAQRLEVGNAWLKRSGNLPLSISLGTDNFYLTICSVLESSYPTCIPMAEYPPFHSVLGAREFIAPHRK
ncbi:hypothetical protein B0H12DRAFT_623079 [Mycena haematopus]|nr:hypothetical protein B0H12DRAFT_623079 [Mycena haematopus]